MNNKHDIEFNIEFKKTITIFVLGFICVILLIHAYTLTIDLNERGKEKEKILKEYRLYQSLCNEAKDNNSRGAKQSKQGLLFDEVEFSEYETCFCGK